MYKHEKHPNGAHGFVQQLVKVTQNVLDFFFLISVAFPKFVLRPILHIPRSIYQSRFRLSIYWCNLLACEFVHSNKKTNYVNCEASLTVQMTKSVNFL